VWDTIFRVHGIVDGVIFFESTNLLHGARSQSVMV